MVKSDNKSDYKKDVAIGRLAKMSHMNKSQGKSVYKDFTSHYEP